MKIFTGSAGGEMKKKGGIIPPRPDKSGHSSYKLGGENPNPYGVR